MSEYSTEIILTKSENELINGYLTASCEEEYQGDDSIISKTAIFPNGFEMDIKCCGCDNEPSWTEAVLFENGSELCCSEPYDEFLGDWELEHKGVVYHVLVRVSNEHIRTISVKPSCFAPEFEMIISIPDDRDAEEYIDELLDGILSDEFRYNVEWDFVDGIS